MDRGVQGLPGRLPGPEVGQVQGEPAGGAGQPGRHVDQVCADGRRVGAGVEGAGEGAGGAGEVVRDGPEHGLGGVGVERSGGQVGQRAGVGVGDDLLDDRVAAVLGLGLAHLEWAGG